MGCGMGLIKYLLFIFNFIFALCGLAILIIGVLAHIELTNYGKSINENVLFPSITLIVIGSVIFVIAFFGCCGAIRESHCMTITFASFLLTLLIVQVAVGVYAFVVLRKLDYGTIEEGYKSIFDEYWEDQANREVVDVIQATFECCGIRSYQDYSDKGFGHFNNTIPWTCCGNKEGESCGVVTIGFPSDPKIYTEGCAPALKRFLEHTGTVLGAVALGIAGVELIGIIFALCLANSIRNADRRGYQV